MAGNPTGVRKTMWTPDVVRERIQASQVAQVLIDHVVEGTELAPSRVTAALGLLKKIVPDLSAVALSGSVEMTKPDELTDAALAHLATAGSARAVESPLRAPEPDELH